MKILHPGLIKGWLRKNKKFKKKTVTRRSSYHGFWIQFNYRMIWSIIYKNLFFDLKQWHSNSILVMPITNFTYIPAVKAIEHWGRKRALAPILEIVVTRLLVNSTRSPQPLNTIQNLKGAVKQPSKFDLSLPSEVLNFFNQLQICRMRSDHYFLKRWTQFLFLNQSQKAHRQLNLKWVWVQMFAKMITTPTTPRWKPIWFKTCVAC